MTVPQPQPEPATIERMGTAVTDTRTPSPQLLAIGTRLKDAIRGTLLIADGMSKEDAVTRLHSAVMGIWRDSLPVILNDAAQNPDIMAGIIANALIPTLRELEDMISDDHDDPKTTDTMRPGLRRAGRLIRDARREAETAQP